MTVKETAKFLPSKAVANNNNNNNSKDYYRTPGMQEQGINYHKAQERSTGFRYFVMGLAIALCIVTLTVAVYKVTRNPHVVAMIRIKGTQRGLNLRPPISHYLKGATSDSGVYTASGKTWPDPPPHEEVAKVARYIVHISDWGSMATISADDKIKGFPFTNILSISDGPIGESTGIPYLYMTPMDLTAIDLEKDNRASISVSEGQSSYCQTKGYDPEDPRCGRALLTGRVIKLANGTREAAEAQKAMFSRHPDMASWPAGHEWYFAKLNITNIYLFDYFGGVRNIGIEEYFKATPFS